MFSTPPSSPAARSPWSGSVALRESTLRPDLRKKLDLPGWIRASVARAVADAEQPVHWLLLNAEANVEIDLTAIDMLDQLRVWLHERGVRLALARVKQDLRDQLDAAGFLDRLGDDRLYATLPTAVDAYERWCAVEQ